MNRLSVVLATLLLSVFTLPGCAPDYSLTVQLQYTNSSLATLYTQEGNTYFFSIYDGPTGNLVYYTEYKNDGSQSFRTDSFPVGQDYFPQVVVYDKAGTIILTGTLLTSDDPAFVPGSQTFSIFSGEKITITMGLGQS